MPAALHQFFHNLIAASVDAHQPAILHLQYARLTPQQDQTGLAPGKQQLDPAALFKNFYQQTAGRELTAAEQQLLTQALTEAAREEQES